MSNFLTHLGVIAALVGLVIKIIVDIIKDIKVDGPQIQELLKDIAALKAAMRP